MLARHRELQDSGGLCSLWSLIAPIPSRSISRPRRCAAARRSVGQCWIPCRITHGETTMDKIKPLFTATATATGGRNGHTESSDGVVKADLSLPKEMGGLGKPGTATPEHLFAAGYAACFGGALDFVGRQQKKDASKAKITCAVAIGPRDGGGFGLSVKMRVEDRSLPHGDLAALTKEAHEKICPYSHATRGNVDVQFEVVGA